VSGAPRFNERAGMQTPSSRGGVGSKVGRLGFGACESMAELASVEERRERAPQR